MARERAASDRIDDPRPGEGGARSSPASSREAFIGASAELLRRQGYAATGLNEIVARSGAPKGSLYFHFPGGKEQLAEAAMGQAGEQLRRGIAAILGGESDLGAALARLVDALAAGLQASGYRDGCPIATVTLEAPAGSERLRTCAEAVFASWLEILRERLIAAGMEAPAAERRALLVISGIEGALILARAGQDLAPLHAVRDELVALSA